MTRAWTATAAALLVLALGASACVSGDGGGAGGAVGGPYLNTSVGGTFRAEAARVR